MNIYGANARLDPLRRGAMVLISAICLSAFCAVPARGQWLSYPSHGFQWTRRLPPTNKNRLGNDQHGGNPSAQQFSSPFGTVTRRGAVVPRGLWGIDPLGIDSTPKQTVVPGEYVASDASNGLPNDGALSNFALPTTGVWPGISSRPTKWSFFFSSQKQENEQREDDEPDAQRSEREDAAAEPGSILARPLGEEPPDTSRAFLRGATVLLEPGQIQLDCGIEYIHFDARDLIGVGTDVAFERVRSRQWFIPLSVRYGLTEKVQLFTNIPIGASLLESTTSSGGDTTSVFGMGDVQAGFLTLLQEQDECSPDIIYGCSFTAPTGADAFHPGQVAYLGGGFWNVETHVTMIKTIEPAVILGGLGYVHYFQADHLGQTIRLGERIIYDFGAGFAVNENVTFSTIVQGAFQFPSEADGMPLPNSSIEPISLRLALTNYISDHKIIEPFIRFGLTEDAPQAELGVVTTYTR